MRLVHAVIHGRVQGVGFRHFVLRCALEHGVRGEVRNTIDGGVEIIAEGDADRLGSFLDDVRQGPTQARVESVETRSHTSASRYSDFSITG